MNLPPLPEPAAMRRSHPQGDTMTDIKPVAWMMANPTHLPESRSLHWEPQKWHITWEAQPLYTAAALDAAVDQERDRIIAALRRLHEIEKNRHNYFACIARQLEEGDL